MKSFKEIYEHSILTEENNKITKEFLKAVVSKSSNKFMDVSNTNKAIIAVPEGTSEGDITSTFKDALKDMKGYSFSDVRYKEKGKSSSGSDAYPAVVAGSGSKLRGLNEKGLRVFITNIKEDGGEGGGGGKPKAADYEAAICVEYNLKTLGKSRKEGLEEAMNIAFQNNSDKIKKYIKKANPYSKSETPLTKTGKAVAEGLSGPKYFVHSGTGIGTAKNFYDGGSDTTPKSDIVGSNDGKKFPRKYRYSLKKLGDSGEGAQLMSGKREESKGIFKASWDSWKNAASSKQGIKKIMDDMQKKLIDNIKISSGVSEIKKNLKKWLFEGSYHKIIIDQTKKNLPKEVYFLNNKKEWVITQTSTIPDIRIQKYIKAIFALSGLLDEQGVPENYLFHEVVGRGKNLEKGAIIDVVMTKNYKLNIRLRGEKTAKLYELYKMTLGEKQKEEISSILAASLKGKELRNDIENFIKTNQNIKRHIVFEAGSGWYKFTGKEHITNEEGIILHGQDPGSPSVADSIMEFSDSGLGEIILMHTYANTNFSLVDRIYVAFKGSGDVRYTSVRMPTESILHKDDLSVLIEKTISSHFDLLYDDLLVESLWGKVKDYAVGAWQKTKQVAASVVQYGKMILNDILDFGKRLFEAAVESIKKIFGELYTMLSQGISQFLDFIGLGEPEGDFTLSG